MKTFLLVVMLLLVAVPLCHAEDNKTEYAVSLDTTKINMGQQVDQVADALKKHLDGPLGMYYKAAVAKTKCVGWVSSAFGTLLVLAGVACMVFWKSYESENWVCGVFAVLSGSVLIGCGSTHVLCPEYYAMNDILTKIGTMVH
jgi:hypothetical protein